MTLTPGTLLGPYEVLASIGAGGMGEVYRARDIRLDRDVALKVLPEHLSGDRAALSRFQTEAKAVAALSHPNILAIFDVGDVNGTRFAVTELLDGQTLRAALARGALGVRRALEIAEQVAQALAAAHENGIVHRDVKPENVFLTREGHVKVLDFGLARRDPGLLSGEDTRSPTASIETGPGVVVGTVAYMSPEQARGAAVDYRSDQFSLGIVLYEMLARKRPFSAESAAQTLAAIIEKEPEPLERAVPEISAPVRFLVERLLAKDPEGRYDSTRDLARELATWRLHPSGTSAASAVASEAAAWPPGGLRRGLSARWLPWAVALGLAAGSVVVALVAGRQVAHPPRAGSFEIALPEGHRLFTKGGRFLDLSPDGKLLVYSAFSWKKPWAEPDLPRLFLRPLDSFESSPIPGTEGGSQPAFSPDGRRIAFAAAGTNGQVLKTVLLEGYGVTTVCECDARFGIAWAPDGSLLFASEKGPLQRVPWGGGIPAPVTTLDVVSEEVSHRLPTLMPDGHTILYTAVRYQTTSTAAGGWIYAQRLGEKTRHLLVEGGTDGRFSPPGLLLYGRQGILMAARLDAAALRLTAAPEPALDGIVHRISGVSSEQESGAVGLAGGRDGALAFAPGSVSPEALRRPTWLDRNGAQVPLEFPPGWNGCLRVSPDGRQVLVSSIGHPVQLLDLERGARRNVTFDGGSIPGVFWGPGPGRFTYLSDNEGPARLFVRRVTASPEETEKLDTAALSICVGGAWSPDGRLLAFVVHADAGNHANHDIWLLERGGAPRPFLASRFQEEWPDISPDGKDLVYGSDEPGRFEVFVRPLDGSVAPLQVSVDGGGSPAWARDGSAIYYHRDVDGKPGVNAVFRVAVTKRPEGLAAGRPEKVLEAAFGSGRPLRTWDVAPDGRFLVVQAPTEADTRAWWERSCPDRIRVVLGGVESLLRGDGKRR